MVKAIRRGGPLIRQIARIDVADRERLPGSFLHRYPLVVIGGCVATGVLLDASWGRSFRTSALCWSLIAAAALALPIFVGSLSKRDRKPARRSVGWASTLIVATAAAAVWNSYCEHSFRTASLIDAMPKSRTPVVVRGDLARTVAVRRNPLAELWDRDATARYQSRLIVSLRSRRIGDTFRPVDGNVVVYADGDRSDLRPGARLEIYGWLRPFEAPSNPGEPDLRGAYRRQHLHGQIETKNASAITVLARSDRPLAKLIASIASRGRQSLMRHTDDQTGPLAIALVLGQRDFVDPSTRDALLATGTAHLLSVSGMHLAILVLIATWGLSALGIRPVGRLLVVVAISALYVAVTGGRPPVIRAAILVAVLLLATCFRRTSQPLNTLALAAILLIAFNPANLFSVGVHLSFLAVITLMMAGNPLAPGSARHEQELERQFRFRTLLEESSRPWVRHVKALSRFGGEMAWMSACVTAVSLPLVWQQFHLVSLVSVVTNVLVWAGLMVALPTGVLTVMLDPIHVGLAVMPGALCHYALQYMWMMISWTASWPGGHHWLPSPPAVMVATFYAVLAGSLISRTRRATWFRGGWFVLWMISAWWVATRPAERPADTLEATFIDVGHGTSVIVRTADNQVWLYDCGRLGNVSGTSHHIDTALWSLGITRLDGVLLSHADADHYNALPALLDRFAVDVVITPPGMLSQSDEALEKLRSAIRRHAVPVREVYRGGESARRLERESGLTVLHPPRDRIGGSDNANSLVIRIDTGTKTLLLPGDLEPPGTRVALSGLRPLPDGVLMAPHHGSLSTGAESVLIWARPAETIVSGGRRAANANVRAMLSATGSAVRVTAEHGAIRTRLSGTGEIEVRTWKTCPW